MQAAASPAMISTTPAVEKWTRSLPPPPPPPAPPGPGRDWFARRSSSDNAAPGLGDPPCDPAADALWSDLDPAAAILFDWREEEPPPCQEKN